MTITGNDIYNVILTAAIGIIVYFLRDLKSSNDKKQDQQDTEISKVRDDLTGEVDKIRDDLTKIITSLPHTYVLRDDFLRAITCLEMKVDTIARDIGELNKNVSKLAGGAKRE